MPDKYTLKSIKENLDYIDLLKTIAIYFVIVYHFNNIQIDFLSHSSPLTYLNYFIMSILSTCVPIFFFVNGALLLNRSAFDLKRHVHKIIKICILVVIWGVITLIALMFIRNQKLSFVDIVKGVQLLKIGWVDHLWFLEALVVIYIFFPLILTAYKKNIKGLYFFFGCVMILTFGNTLLINCMTVIGYVYQKFSKIGIENFFSDFNAFRGIYGYSLGYFILGGLLFPMRSYFSTKKNILFSTLALFLSMSLLFLYGVIASKKQNEVWDIVWYGYDTVFTLINVVSIFILSLRYKHKSIFGKAIALVGKNSLGIYFIHRIIGYFLQPFYYRIDLSSTFLMTIVFASITLFCSLIIVLTLKKLPLLNYLFSV